MEPQRSEPIAVGNSWQILGDTPGGGRGARGGARGGRAGGRGRGGSLPTASDAIAAFRNARGGGRGGTGPGGIVGAPSTTITSNGTDGFHTYQNRSNLQRARKEGGVRTLTVDEAVQEIEDKSRAVHENNIGGRSALWGQWCRRMEDSRLDVDCRYLDPARDNSEVTFDQVFLRSKALEDAVASVLRYPLSDDTELAFLFSHCLEGDGLFHQKIAEGLKAVGECFRDNNRVVPDEFVEQMLAVIRALKADPSIKRDAGQALHRVDEQIAFNVAKSQELSREGASSAPETRHRCSAELVRLGVEKHKLLTGSAGGGGAGASGGDTIADRECVRVLFEELLSVIDNILEECTASHSQAQRQFEAFQTKIRAAMMGDDVEYQRVIEEDARLDAEINRLMAKRAELQRQLDEVSVELQTVEHKKKQHNAASHKIMSTYHQRMKNFAGENQKMSHSHEKAASALERTTKSKQFLSSLCESTASMLADRAQQRERVKTDMNRQVLVYVLQHLENSRQTVDLINRRFNFCRSKLDTMRSELQEAKDIGLNDLAADLQAAVVKFEAMQKDAKMGLESTRGDLEQVQVVLSKVVPASSTSDDANATAMREQIQSLVSSLQQAVAEVDGQSPSTAALDSQTAE